MRRRSIAVLGLIVFVAGFAAMFAPAPAARAGEDEAGALSKVAWIARSWRGVHGQTILEETWSKPAAGTMVGMFRMISGGKARMYEFMSIEERGEEIALFMHHYSPGLAVWEAEPLEWKLTDVSDHQATFTIQNQPEPKKLIFTRQGNDGILIRLVDYEAGESVNRDFSMKAVD